MADWGSATVDRLEAHLPFWTPLGGRVDWTVSPPETPYPRCVLTGVSDDRPDHYSGPDLRQTRLQLDVYSSVSAAEANDIAEQSVDALQPEAIVSGIHFRRAASVEGPVDGGDQLDTLYAYRARVDFVLLHSPI